jgi:hypothetical protein
LRWLEEPDQGPDAEPDELPDTLPDRIPDMGTPYAVSNGANAVAHERPDAVSNGANAVAHDGPANTGAHTGRTAAW